MSLGLNLLLLTGNNDKGLTEVNRLIQFWGLGLKKYSTSGVIHACGLTASVGEVVLGAHRAREAGFMGPMLFAH